MMFDLPLMVDMREEISYSLYRSRSLCDVMVLGSSRRWLWPKKFLQKYLNRWFRICVCQDSDPAHRRLRRGILITTLRPLHHLLSKKLRLFTSERIFHQTDVLHLY